MSKLIDYILEIEDKEDEMLDTIKILLELEDNSKDKLLSIYLKSSMSSIISFCNFDEESTILNLNNMLCNAVIELTILKYRSRGHENVTQMSQGARSVTFKNAGGSYQNSLPSEIETMCRPYRKVKVMR